MVTLPRLVRQRSPISGWGVYAAQPIAEDTRIVEYKGELVSQAEGWRREQRYLPRQRIWIFNVNERWVRDAAFGGNIRKLAAFPEEPCLACPRGRPHPPLEPSATSPRQGSIDERRQRRAAIRRLELHEKPPRLLDVLLGAGLLGAPKRDDDRIVRTPDESQRLRQTSHRLTVDPGLIHLDLLSATELPVVSRNRRDPDQIRAHRKPAHRQATAGELRVDRTACSANYEPLRQALNGETIARAALFSPPTTAA